MGSGAFAWHSVDGRRPPWIEELREVSAGIGKALPSVHREYDAWDSAHPVPANAHPAGRRTLERRWLCDASLASARRQMEALGFQVEGDVPSTDPAVLDALRARFTDFAEIEELEPRPWPVVRPVAPAVVGAPGVGTGYRQVVVDAWHPADAVAVAVEWDPEPSTLLADYVMWQLTIDAGYLVLLHQATARDGTRPYDVATRAVAGLFADDHAKRNIERKLRVRGVLVVAI